jgi:hypothetical protein
MGSFLPVKVEVELSTKVADGVLMALSGEGLELVDPLVTFVPRLQSIGLFLTLAHPHRSFP